jgi:ZIP family zinc transporter
MSAVALALLAAAGFVGSSLLGLLGHRLPDRSRSYAITVAAGILLVVAFGDLFPEGLEAAGQLGIAGFIGGFALLAIVEMLTHAHTHHAPSEHVHKHALVPFIVGLALHNLADGFALGITTMLPSAAAGLVGLGVLVHQVPVGLSLAAVFVAGQVPRRGMLRFTLLLGLAIPLAAAVTAAVPALDEQSTGIAVGVAGGVLAYLATGHLLPEAQREAPSRMATLIFLATLAIMTLALFTVLAE